jgi:two-component system NtrC family sensor kinase
VSAAVEPIGEKGLRILADVATYLAAGLGAEDVLTRVAGALARGLETNMCRVWVRSADGARYRAIVAEGLAPPADRPSGQIRMLLRDEAVTSRADGEHRFPLTQDGEELGVLEVAIPGGPGAATMRRVVEIVAKILSPLLASIELSEDLASEVALRTREIDSQRRFTTRIIDSLPVGLYVIDRQYRIQAWNRKRETGIQGVVRQEAIGRKVFDVLHRQPTGLLKQEFDRVFETGQMEQMEVTSETFGERRYYRLTKIPMRVNDDDVTHVITIGEDVTDWKAMQQQAAQAEKLAAVGQLAAGVMHELNNPLATIGACVEALDARLDDVPIGARAGIQEYLTIVEAELGRCNAIVNGLLDFSRPKGRVKRPARINQIVEDALFLVKHHDQFKRITLKREMVDGLPLVQANTEQLIQVFLALMLNALDAMEGKGVLTIRTGFNPDDRGEVLVEVVDTGMGIPSHDLPKIFDPFFTTKQPGHGTGLGLSICYGIVQEHRGRITVESQVGRGATFRVFLPVSGDDGSR